MRIFCGIILTTLSLFAQVPPVQRQAFTTNTVPVAAAAVQAAINGTTGTGAFVMSSNGTSTNGTSRGLNAYDYISLGNAFKVTFVPDLLADEGINVGSIAGDPATASVGGLWYNSTTSKLKAKIGSGTKSIMTGLTLNLSAPLTGGGTIDGEGTLAISFSSQSANTVLAGPASGGATTPTFRTLVASDLPNAPLDSTFTNITVLGTAAIATETVGSQTLTNNPTWPSDAQALVWASPAASSGAPTFRALVAADIPTALRDSTLTNVTITGGARIGALLVDSTSGGQGAWTSGGGNSPNSWFVQNFSWKEWGYSAGASGAALPYGLQSWTTTGTQTIITAATNIAAFNWATTTSSNGTAGIYTSQEFSAAANEQVGCTIAPTTLATMRVFVGFSTGVDTAMVQTDSPTGDYIGFRYSTTASETTWHVINRDNSNTDTTDTLVNVTTNGVTMYFIGNDGGTSWDLWIDGAKVLTTATHLPRTSQAFRFMSVISTQSGAAVAVNLRGYTYRGRSRSYPGL